MAKAARTNAAGAKAKIAGAVHEARTHDSAHKHVSGEAVYIDDMPEPAGLLHACLGLSDIAHGRVETLDLDAVRAAPGVALVLTASDIPGVNDVSPVGRGDDPVFARTQVAFYGQPLFAVIAETRHQARLAARLAKVRYRPLTAYLDIDAARAAGAALVTPPLTLARGDVAKGLDHAPHRIKGRMEIGGQDHFYLEGHIALAVPGEDGDMLIYASTQHPSEVQHMVAHVLGVPRHAVICEVRRMGGGFGGKETQGNLFAAVAALAARRLGRAVKIRPDRDDDMTATGKRHDFAVDYEVGFSGDGRVLAVDFTYAARCGFSADLSGPVTDRALFHCDNAYFYPAVRAHSLPLKTNTVSNTAFRGFGGPQGMLGAERIMDEIAFALGKDPLDIRKANFYDETGHETGQRSGRNVTPYHQQVDDCIIARIVGELEAASEYRARRRVINAFNGQSEIVKRGLALTPVKFGISFTATHFNQAGALVHVYADGSVMLNHGGTEMGQGLNIKVAQVVAEEFQIDLEHIKITATSTAKVPNTSATAASSGTDLNAMAARQAARAIKERLRAFAAARFDTPAEQVDFLPNRVKIGAHEMTFAALVEHAYRARVQLSATGFYKTPNIHWDRGSGRGQPFHYFAYGAAVSEVEIDTLTGEYRLRRVDILHDCGRSLNAAVDRGQIEGGFVQGMGWLTTEELCWDAKGRLTTHAPSTYKIPLASDVPDIFNVTIADWSRNRQETIHRSKAVGEPPLMLAMSVFHALGDAVASVAGHTLFPALDAPATPERVLMAVERLKQGRR